MRKATVLLSIALTLLLSIAVYTPPIYGQTNQILDPQTIPKWVNQLNGPPPVYVPVNITDTNGNLIRQDYNVTVTQTTQQMLPTTDTNGNPTGFKQTKIWAYSGPAKDPTTGQYLGNIASTPGPTIEAIRYMPTRVQWTNGLIDQYGQSLSSFLPVDPTLHWANPRKMTMPAMPVNAPPFPLGYFDAQRPVPIVTHLHGAEVPSSYDGHPDAWYTPDGTHGPAYATAEPTTPNAAIYEYPNTQEPTTLWYHDHALGITRTNILSGLVGFYKLEDPADPIAPLLPKGKYDVPLCIQDRTFLTDSSLHYPTQSNYPQIHPYWTEAFLGNTIIVNGKVWPNMNVEQGLYRFRLLDASNSRFYLFTFSNGMEFTQIASDGGYLKAPAPLTSLLLGPAERADILVDFSNIEPGTTITLQNLALTTTTEEERQTIGQIMQFTITNAPGPQPNTLPQELNPTLTGTYPTLQDVTKQRNLSLIEATGDNGTLAMYLDGQKWGAPITENPLLETTEEWIIANPTISAHPIHLHLVQFQIISRQLFNDTAYLADWTALNGPPPLNQPTKNVPSLEPYLIGEPTPPPPNEQGWKDTAVMFAGEVTTIRVRFTQQSGSQFPFDATTGPGYVWHCHLLEHEDNEMMRPYTVTQSANQTTLSSETIITIVAATIVIAIIILFIIGRKRLRRQPTQN